MKRLSVLPVILLMVASAAAGAAQSPQVASGHLLAPLDFLVGEWGGEVWRPNAAEGQKAFWFVDIRYTLGGRILLFEEVGSNTEDRTQSNRHVLALVYPSPAGEDYVVDLYAPSQSSVASFAGKVQVVNRSFTLQTEGSGEIYRFVIEVDEEGHWYGVGTRSQDKGETWGPMWEMRLRRLEN